MQVTSTCTKTHTINDDTGFRVATVVLTDEAPGKGRFTVVANGTTYSCYWNSMGDLDITEFFKATNDDYVVGCLDPFGTLFRKINPAILKGIIAQDIAGMERHTDEQKVNFTARLVELEPISDVNGLVALNGTLMTQIYGPMWVNQVNERFLGQHPAYTDLFEKVATIRTALFGEKAA
jgi:hypothetical protein